MSCLEADAIAKGYYTASAISESGRYNQGTGLVADSMVDLNASTEDAKQWIMDHGAIYAGYHAFSGNDAGAKKYYNSSTGTATVTCTILDADGNPIVVNGEVLQDSVQISCKAGFLTKLFNFFRILFGLIKNYEI